MKLSRVIQMIDLNKVSPSVGKIAFAVNIYLAFERKQHFDMLQNAFIRLMDMDKDNEICRYNLSANYYGMEGLIAGDLPIQRRMEV